MDAFRDSTAVAHVRLLADYSHEDVSLRRGEEYAVLGYHGDEWIYVSRGANLQPCYVPAYCVQPVTMPAEAKARTLPANSSLYRVRTFAASSGPKVAGLIRSLSMRDPSSSVEYGSDIDDFPDPPPNHASSSPLTCDVTTSETTTGDGHNSQDDRDVTRGARPSSGSDRREGGDDVIEDQSGTLGVSNPDRKDTRTNGNTRRSQYNENYVEDSSPAYANWAEIRRLVDPNRTGATSNTTTGAAPAPDHDVTSAGNAQPTASVSSQATTSTNLLQQRANSDNTKETPRWLPDEDKNDEVFNMSLVNKHGYLQCLHATENGRAVAPAQWKTTYAVLNGALLSFYGDELSARDTRDGPIQLPRTSLGLQGAVIQMTRYDYPAYDVIKITTSFNTMYMLRAIAVQDTHSWCRYIKHNVAVQLADRTARMETATPVSTFTATPKPRGRVNTDNTSTVTRVAQRLKDLLSRRPTREDLKDRGIYTDPLFGSTLAAVCAKDKALVPIFLMQCFKEIERRGLAISGIYRLSGSIAKVQKLRILANQGDYDVSEVDDIHTLTGIVRVFFRELAEPLIPFEFFERCCDSYKKSSQSARQEAFIHLIQDLPEVHRMTMRELFCHLEKVIKNNAENQMTSHNLAIVFGPTLMWLPVNNEKNYSAMVVLQGQIVEYLIKEHRNLFLPSQSV